MNSPCLLIGFQAAYDTIKERDIVCCYERVWIPWKTYDDGATSDEKFIKLCKGLIRSFCMM
jgi:hypothetical protein